MKAKNKPYTPRSGPFAGLALPFASSLANAAHITSTLVDTYLVTHPHLDHISGLVINTVIPISRPRRLAGSPSTIAAIKTHIFNDVIWPNLSDENKGAGLVTYLRLVEGGDPAAGCDESKGYSDVCHGLGAKLLAISHGHCLKKHNHRGSQSFSQSDPDVQPNSKEHVPGEEPPKMCVVNSSAYFIRDTQSGREVLIFGDVEPDSISLFPRNRQVWHEAAPKIIDGRLRCIFIECSYDDSQDEDALFGHMAPKYLSAELCTLAAAVRDARDELASTAPGMADSRKRKAPENVDSLSTTAAVKRTSKDPLAASTDTTLQDCSDGSSTTPRQTRLSPGLRRLHTSKGQSLVTRTTKEPSASDAASPSLEGQLAGLKIVILHIKERLDDGPEQGTVILQQLESHEAVARLGCEFFISRAGMSVSG